MTIIMKRIVAVALAIFMLFTLHCILVAAGASGASDAISGWDGPIEEGVTWFATEDLSLHGGFDPELNLVLDGATKFPPIVFGIVNSAGKAVSVEPFYIKVCVYRADDIDSNPVCSFDIPMFEGTMPAHSRYIYNAKTWYGTDKNGEMLPDGKYILRSHIHT
jgi:hypothetical protein